MCALSQFRDFNEQNLFHQLRNLYIFYNNITGCILTQKNIQEGSQKDPMEKFDVQHQINQLMQESSQIIKQRQERFQRLRALIEGHTRTRQELREMDDIKKETLFQISLRYKQAEPNHSYVFPRNDKSPDELLSQEQRQFISRRDILYDLNAQALVQNEELRPKRSTIQRMQTELVVSSNSKPKKIVQRPLLNRIDLRISKLLSKDEPRSQRRLTQKSPVSKSTQKLGQLKVPLLKNLQSSMEKSPRIVEIDRVAGGYTTRDKVPHLVPIVSKKKINSHNSSPTQMKQVRITTEDSELPRKRTEKKLYTQQGQSKRKLMIQTILNFQTNKRLLIGGKITSTIVLKPKNMFQRPMF